MYATISIQSIAGGCRQSMMVDIADANDRINIVWHEGGARNEVSVPLSALMPPSTPIKTGERLEEINKVREVSGLYPLTPEALKSIVNKYAKQREEIKQMPGFCSPPMSYKVARSYLNNIDKMVAEVDWGKDVVSITMPPMSAPKAVIAAEVDGTKNEAYHYKAVPTFIPMSDPKAAVVTVKEKVTSVPTPWQTGHDPIFGTFRYRYHQNYKGVCEACNGEIKGEQAMEKERGRKVWFIHTPDCKPRLLKKAR